MDGPHSGDLPEDLWLQVAEQIFSQSFIMCGETNSLRICRHISGFCVNRTLLSNAQSSVIALSGVSRRMRLILQPVVFRTIFFPDILSAHNMKRNPMVAFDTKVMEQKGAVLRRSLTKIDELLRRPDLYTRVRSLYMDGWDASISTLSDTSHNAETPLQLLTRKWSRSFEELLSRLVELECILIKTSRLSANAMTQLHSLPALKNVYMVASSTFVNHGYTPSPTVSSSLETIQYVPDFTRSSIGTLTIPFIAPFHHSSLRTLTTVEFCFSGADKEEYLVPDTNLHFPALRTIHIRVLNPNKAIDSISLADRIEGFFRVHPEIDDLRLGPSSSETPWPKWFLRLIQPENRSVLPNLRTVWASPEACIGVAIGRPVKRFHMFLSSLIHLSHLGFDGFPQLTEGPTFIRINQLVPHVSEKDARLWQYSLLASAVLPLKDTLEEFGWTCPDKETFEELQAARHNLMQSLHLYPRLRSIEVNTKDSMHANHGLTRRHISPDEEGWCRCLRPTTHPVLMSDSPDLTIRGHPRLERVKIASPGTWAWSDSRGWEYCF